MSTSWKAQTASRGCSPCVSDVRPTPSISARMKSEMPRGAAAVETRHDGQKSAAGNSDATLAM
eukprot:4043538-Prymnesium_polylepis.1